MKKFLKAFAGFILMPIYLSVYLYDRAICVPLVWIQHDSLLTWLRDETKIAHSIIRAGVVGLIHFLIWFLL